MKKSFAVIPWIAVFLFFSCACGYAAQGDTPPEVSGKIVDGFRVLSVKELRQNPAPTVFRGDYIKFMIDDGSKAPALSIPALKIDQKLPEAFGDAPYFKMKTKGVYAYTLGESAGKISVVPYTGRNYRKVNAKEAAAMIETFDPVILDVRTPREYKRGHLKNAILLPVQKLQKRVNKLSKYKDRRVLIYCATGNRSTVASKILIDKGFKRIFNLGGGIAGWGRERYPIVK
jgi:rhodanese-related sulfurtransferase